MSQGNRSKKWTVIISILAVLLLTAVGLAFSGMTTVKPGHKGVGISAFSGTQLDTVYGEGMNFHAFWIEILPFNVRSQSRDEPVTAPTSAGLPVEVDVTIRFRPDPENLPQLYQQYGKDYYDTVVKAELRSTFRDAMDDYTPEDLYSDKRTKLQKSAEAALKARLKKCFINLETLLVRNIDLPQKVKERIESKVGAEQDLETEQIQAKRKLIRGRAQAEYQKIVGQNLTPAFLKFKEIEANLQIADKLANSPNTKIFFNGNNGSDLTQAIIQANEASRQSAPVTAKEKGTK